MGWQQRQKTQSSQALAHFLLYIFSACLFSASLRASGSSIEHYFYKRPQPGSLTVLSAVAGVSFQNSLFGDLSYEPNLAVVGARLDANLYARWSNRFEFLAGTGSEVVAGENIETGSLQGQYGILRVVTLGPWHFSFGPSVGYMYFLDRKKLKEVDEIRSQTIAGLWLDAAVPVSDGMRVQVSWAINRGLEDSSIDQQQVLASIGWRL
jgi:hypothetical protein